MNLLEHKVGIKNFHQFCEEYEISKDKKDKYLKIQIPHYQRPFKWKKARIRSIIEDFNNNFLQTKPIEDKSKLKIKISENKDDPLVYFAGAIVTVNNEKEIQLIDGQQRLTTIYIVNYIRFLLLRSYIEQLILLEKPSTLNESISHLSEIYYQYIQYKKEHFVDLTEKVEDLNGKLDDCENKDEEKPIYERLIKLYREKLGIPNFRWDNEKKYLEQSEHGLMKLFGDTNLNFYYSRSSLNNKLKRALSKVCIKLTDSEGPKFIDIDSKIDDVVVEKYYNSAKIIFNKFKNITPITDEVNSLDYTLLIKNKLDYFLGYVNICMIPTGNIEEAYTLFEVLNDRALKVDDLELIKNLFYQRFYTTTGLKEEKKELCISKLEELWGDNIFEENIIDGKRDLTSFLATIFFTGSKKVLYKENREYRNKIREDYLDLIYSDEGCNYTDKYIKFEFIMFEAIKTLLTDYEILFGQEARKSIEVENDRVSITYKTFHLLKAFGFEGVMPALSNLILRTFLEKQYKKFDNLNDLINEIRDVDKLIDKFKHFIKDLKEDGGNSDERFKDIHYLANSLWRLSLLTNDYTEARKKTVEIISKVNLKENSIERSNLSISHMLEEDGIKDKFLGWTVNWRKNSTRNNLPINVLLVNLINMEKDKDKLKKTGDILTTYAPGTYLTLDHFEPEKYRSEHQDDYYIPSEEMLRKDHVNKLGNFMLLSKEENREKGNPPAEVSFDYYEKSLGENHWIIQELKKVLEENHKKDGKYKVPTKDFFEKRTTLLINEFWALLMMGLNDTEVTIQKID